jgi:hypothetical protein
MPLTPLSRRLVGLAGLLSLLLIAVVVNYLAHEGDEILNPVAQAAQKTARQPGAHLAFEITLRGEGEPVIATGNGNYDARADRTDAEMQVTGPGGSSTWVETIGDDRTDYTRSGDLETVLPTGKLWLGMQPLLGHSSQTALGSQTEAGGTMKVLETLGGGVEEVGHELVRGHETTRYKTTLEMSQAARILRRRGEPELAREYGALAARVPDPIPVEAWVDERGLVRMLRMVEPLPATSGAKPLSIDMRMEFFRFGKQPHIPLPAEGTVFDYTPVLRAELGLLDGSVLGKLGPRAGAKPLPVVDFQRRVRGICRRLVPQARPLIERERQLMGRARAIGRGSVERGLPLTSPTILDELKSDSIALGHEVEAPLYVLARRATRELAAVPPPGRYASTYERYLQMDAVQDELILAGTRALEMGVVDTRRLKSKAGSKAEAAERKRLAARLGVSVCERKIEGSGAGSPRGSGVQTEVE